MTEYSNPYSQSEYPATYSDPVLTGTETTTGQGTGGATESFEGYTDRPVPGVSESPDGSDNSMKDKAAESAQAGKQAAGEVASTAADKAKDVAQETKQQARNVLGQAQDQLKQQTAAQHQSLVSNLHAIGDQLGSMAHNSDQSGYATDLVSQAGDRVHSAASFLESRQPSELVDELRRFARQKPGTFILGALAAGVVAGRLTRGVVAAHKDDSGDSGSSGSHAAGLTSEDSQQGYAPTASYGTTEGYGDAGGYSAGDAGGYAAQGSGTTGGYGTAGYGTTGTTGYDSGYASGGAAAGGIEP
jgi:hypothetical protein